jgi:hypothetical protein
MGIKMAHEIPVGDVYAPFKKTDGVVGFRADGAYMFTPFEV